MRMGAERAGNGRSAGRISAGVVARNIEGNGMDSLWRVLSVIQAGQGRQDEVKKLRDRVVATVQEMWKAGELEVQLPPGYTGR